MRQLAKDSFGQVSTAVFNAGNQVKPRQVAAWLKKQNPQLSWTEHPIPGGVQLRGTDPARAAQVTVDVNSTEAGVLVRAIDPGPSLETDLSATDDHAG